MKAAKNRPWLRVLSIGCVVAVWGCGADEDGGEPVSGFQEEVSFADSAEGEQFLIIPFALGNLENVDGAGAETVSFKMTTDAAVDAGAGLQLLRRKTPNSFSLASSMAETKVAEEYGKRTILRLFDPDRGLDQNPAVWSVARELDAINSGLPAGHGNSFGFVADPNRFSFERELKSIAMQKSPSAIAPVRAASALTQTGCPVTDDEVVRPGVDLEPDVADVTEVVDEEEFCIVIVSDPATVTVEEAKVATTAILKRYKEVIYKDEFTGAADFTFKPVIVIVDFKDPEYWEAENDLLNSINGIFFPEMSDITKHPMLYMASDLASILGDSDLDAAMMKKRWVGTLAHEMQHAISNFYKKRKVDGAEETVAIEEGQAHFMEYLFGYGQPVYDSLVKPFFDVFAFGSDPLLKANDIFDLAGRGPALSMLYYLSSQKGGVTFSEEGVVSGGGGLDFVLDTITDTEDEGASQLASLYGGEWTETIKHYFGALALDGTDVEWITDEQKVQEPVTGVKDLDGNTDNTFGFRFNGDGIEDHLAEYEPITAEEFKGDIELSYYGFKPALYTVSDPEAKVTVTSTFEENVGVAVVRVK